MRLSWKFSLLIMAGLVAYDSFQDAVGGCVLDPPGAVACHGCPCGPHLPTDTLAVVSVPVTPTHFVAYQPSLVVNLLPESIFHPPKTST